MTMTIPWLSPPVTLTLTAATVDVWQAVLSQPASIRHHLRQSLSAAELSRAKRFHFERDRQHFIVGRGVLRDILSRYTKETPGDLHFGYTAYGKPFLDRPADSELRFNLSHSGDLALYAISHERDLGLDVEQIRPMPDALDLAARFFSARENETLQTVPPAQRHEAFFNAWTRKEAYIKALGEGLSHPLDSFDVSLRPAEPARLLAVRGDPQALHRWQLVAFTPQPGYIAALVAAGQGWKIQGWRWSP